MSGSKRGSNAYEEAHADLERREQLWKVLARGSSALLLTSPRDSRLVLRLRLERSLDSEPLRRAVERIFEPFAVRRERVNDFAEYQPNLLTPMAVSDHGAERVPFLTIEIKPKRCGSFERLSYRACDLFANDLDLCRSALRSLLEGPQQLRKLLRLHWLHGEQCLSEAMQRFRAGSSLVDWMARVIQTSPALARVHRVQQLHSCDHALVKRLFELERRRLLSTPFGRRLRSGASRDERLSWFVGKTLDRRAAIWLVQNQSIIWSHIELSAASEPGSDQFYALYNLACIANDCSILIRIDEQGFVIDHTIVDLDCKPFVLERITRRASVYGRGLCPHEAG
ncbi:hypothetical protein CYME_CMH142C [Cyanidioschyzon merolae strain 10D]|jgi:hypothetical protein|uniref:Inositol-pentakisphosphate 2-kinase n=1 Tax=Cyanidioschyzon merolae (strain NIES-3377 / 10D) TaxID=280699 RepID=M1VGK4_CYAM1|nr:hypothetical protein CYME_CMH142C [Cyanidioschyzon merolae strain 10D]BAM79813.1 hypothetical protein CYME_CMH142C [Cyanidioschyzon merolae strain 10D]|eukprot:XP_005536099.1 hypothetical protein CYME_CMH142C [Cyanidioschyzon merolae strain 10D]